jgi:hypothetical protein
MLNKWDVLDNPKLGWSPHPIFLGSVRVHVTWLNGWMDGVKNPAIVLDIDDTSESSYSWEVSNDFGFGPVSDQADAATGELGGTARRLGLHLTGRNEFQGPASLKNLANEDTRRRPRRSSSRRSRCATTCRAG